MKAHNGMRPQDIVILLKIIALGKKDWQYRDLSHNLLISISEISESLNRSHTGGLVDESGHRVFKAGLLEFIEHGIRFVFPQVPGTMVTGVPTAHSHPYFKRIFPSDMNYVWPFEVGDMRGLAITPLHKAVPAAAALDDDLYQLLAAVDIIRVGQAREKKAALELLRKEIKS
jgi:hypothetical protein